jgi:hypothetical protein
MEVVAAIAALVLVAVLAIAAFWGGRPSKDRDKFDKIDDPMG